MSDLYQYGRRLLFAVTAYGSVLEFLWSSALARSYAFACIFIGHEQNEKR